MTNKELQAELSKWPPDAIVYDRDHFGYVRHRIKYVWGADDDDDDGLFADNDEWHSEPCQVKYIILGA